MSTPTTAIHPVTVTAGAHVRDIETQFKMNTLTGGTPVLHFGDWVSIFLRSEDEAERLANIVLDYCAEQRATKDAEQAA